MIENTLIATRIARLLAAELEAAAARQAFGVIVRDIAPLDTAEFLDQVAALLFRDDLSLRIALIDQEEAVSDALRRHPHLDGLVCHTEEQAIRWRNDNLRTIGVITDRPLQRAASLGSFDVSGEQELVARLCLEERERADVTQLRNLWDAIMAERAPRFAVADVVTFAENLQLLDPVDRSANAHRLLHHLDLFPDSQLGEEGVVSRIITRLRRNAEQLMQVRAAIPSDWERVTRFCRSHPPGAERNRRNHLRKQLRSLAVHHNEVLPELDLPKVEKLWRNRSVEQDTVENNDTDTGATRQVPVEERLAELILNGDEAKLADLVNEMGQAIDNARDNGAEQKVVIQSGSNHAVRTVLDLNLKLMDLVRSRSTGDCCGGVIDIDSERIETYTDMFAFKGWRPLLIKEFKSGLQTFVDAGVVPGALLDTLELLLFARLELLEHSDMLTTSPAYLFAGCPQALTACIDYLDAYESLLKQMNGVYADMCEAAMEEAGDLVQWLLSMELYVYRNGEQFTAVMSPLHPLYLWRYRAAVTDLKSAGRETFSEHEVQTLNAACAEELALLGVLILPERVTGQVQPVMLGNAGSLDHLPLFRVSPRGLYVDHGFDAVADLARRLATLRPFARPGQQVMIVNAPLPHQLIELLLDPANMDLNNPSTQDTYWGMHLRLRYTGKDTLGWTNGLDEMEDELSQRIRAGQNHGLISLSVQSEPCAWSQVVAELEQEPAHLTVVFDPFETRPMFIAGAGLHYMNPWVPSSEYRYNHIKKEVTAVPVAEEHLFGAYHNTAALICPQLKSGSTARLPQVKEVRGHLEAIARHSAWTVIGDPHRVPMPRLGTSEIIDRRVDGSRQMTCYSQRLDPFVRRFDEQLRRTHFRADPDTICAMVRELAGMEPSGIMRLAKNGAKAIKGVLGKLIAVRWYRQLQPCGLAVSLDTPAASRWLGDAKEKADTLALWEDGEGVVIDVTEVKAHDAQKPPAHAFTQIFSTLRPLAEIFSPEGNSTRKRPRREVLRDHLYSALMRDADPAYVERWYWLLEDVFAGRIPVRLRGRVIHVHMESVAERASAVHVVPPFNLPIEVVHLSAMDVGFVLTPTRLSTSTRPADDSLAHLPLGDSAVLEPAEVLRLLVVHEKNHSDGEQQPEGEGTNVNETAEALELADGEVEAWGAADATDGEPVLSSEQIVAPTGELLPLGDPFEASVTSAAVSEATIVGHQPTDSSGPTRIEVTLGVERSSKRPVKWIPSRQTNPFVVLLGSSGAGKTETIKVLTHGVMQSGVPVLVIDFHGDVVVPGTRSVLLSSGIASTVGINPMEPDTLDNDKVGLYDQRRDLRDLIRKAVPSLGHRQRTILREAIELAYSEAGFDDADPSTWSRPAPTFADLSQILLDWMDDDERKAQRNAIEGCYAAVEDIFEHPIFQRSEYVSLDELLHGNLHLDVSKLPPSVRYVTTVTLLNKIFRALQLQGPVPVQPRNDQEQYRLFVVIDEAKILSMGEGDPNQSDLILNTLFTEARKFGLGMILASQMCDHFGEEVSANAATRIVLKPGDYKEAKKNAMNIRVDAESVMALAGRGDGYFRDGASPQARRIQVLPLKVEQTEGDEEAA